MLQQEVTPIPEYRYSLHFDAISHPCFRYSVWETGEKISSDRLTYVGSKHWSTALVNGCADVGNWYFEATINEPDKNWLNFKIRGWDCECNTVQDLIEMFPNLRKSLMPNVRVGFGTRLARLESPIGENPFGCSISQNNGDLISNGKRFKGVVDKILPGDVICCAISLGNPRRTLPDPRGHAKLWPFLRKALLIDVTDKKAIEEAKVPNQGSKAQFSVNGTWSPAQITNLYCVEYHPGISTFMGASATINLGPNFKYKPPNDSYRPACEMGVSRYPCKEDLLKFWILGDNSVLSKDAVINREYNKTN